jgi:hypothetical protein
MTIPDICGRAVETVGLVNDAYEDAKTVNRSDPRKIQTESDLQRAAGIDRTGGSDLRWALSAMPTSAIIRISAGWTI